MVLQHGAPRWVNSLFVRAISTDTSATSVTNITVPKCSTSSRHHEDYIVLNNLPTLEVGDYATVSVTLDLNHPVTTSTKSSPSTTNTIPHVPHLGLPILISLHGFVESPAVETSPSSDIPFPTSTPTDPAITAPSSDEIISVMVSSSLTDSLISESSLHTTMQFISGEIPPTIYILPSSSILDVKPQVSLSLGLSSATSSSSSSQLTTFSTSPPNSSSRASMSFGVNPANTSSTAPFQHSHSASTTGKWTGVALSITLFLAICSLLLFLFLRRYRRNHHDPTLREFDPNSFNDSNLEPYSDLQNTILSSNEHRVTKSDSIYESWKKGFVQNSEEKSMTASLRSENNDGVSLAAEDDYVMDTPNEKHAGALGDGVGNGRTSGRGSLEEIGVAR